MERDKSNIDLCSKECKFFLLVQVQENSGERSQRTGCRHQKSPRGDIFETALPIAFGWRSSFHGMIKEKDKRKIASYQPFAQTC